MSIDMNDALRRAQEAADVARAELRHALRAATHTQALMILPLIVEAAELDKKIEALVAHAPRLPEWLGIALPRSANSTRARSTSKLYPRPAR